MSVERPVIVAGSGSVEPPAAPPAPRQPDPEMLQILSTEHWSLLATRSLIWNEAFARSGMFFTVLSGATVALALIAQATSFGSEFVTFTLVILPIVIFVGLATFVRIVQGNLEDARWVVAMNRIRAGYMERRPDLARFFTTGFHDDMEGVLRTFTGEERSSDSTFSFVLHGLTTTPSTLAAVVSAVAAVLVGTIVFQIGDRVAIAVLGGAVGFLILFGLLGLYQYRAFARSVAHINTRFPKPPVEL